MNKTFNLKVENKAPERQADSIKHEIKKYLTRERKKKLPEGFNVWDFDCKIGVDADNTAPVRVTDINTKISELCTAEVESFFLVIHARASNKIKSPAKS
jgi:hypothetical protein